MVAGFVGIEADGLAEFGDGLVGLPLAFQGDAEVDVGKGVLGVDSDGLAIADHRLLQMQTRIVQIAYRVRNGTRFFDTKDPDSHDEFYWNVTGNDWQVPIDHAAASVHFPAGASGSLRAQAFTGVYGSTQRDANGDPT